MPTNAIYFGNLPQKTYVQEQNEDGIEFNDNDIDQEISDKDDCVEEPKNTIKVREARKLIHVYLCFMFLINFLSTYVCYEQLM